MTIADETKQSRFSVVVHLVAAVVMGWISFTLSAVYTKWLFVFLGFAVLVAIGFALERVVGKKGVKWWLGNGGIIYLFVWVVTWVLLFNLGLA